MAPHDDAPIRGAKRWVEVGLRAFKAYGEDSCGLLAAGITYYTLVSLFPLLLAALSVAGFFLTDAEDQSRFIDQVIDSLPLSTSEGRDDLAQVVSSIVSARGTLGIIGIAGAVWAGSALFTSVRTSLNTIFRVKHRRPFVLGKVIDIAAVFGFGVLMLLSATATVLIALAQRFANDLVGDSASFPVTVALSLAYFTVPALVSSTVFFLLYTVVPHHGAPARQVIPGVVVAAVAFEALKIGFTWYVASFGNYNATYGSLGFVIVLLLFVSFASQILLLGAEVAWANGELIRREPATPEAMYQLDVIRAKVRKILRLSPSPVRAPRAAASPAAAPMAQPGAGSPSGAPATATSREATPRAGIRALVAAWLLLIGVLATGVLRWRKGGSV